MHIEHRILDALKAQKIHTRKKNVQNFLENNKFQKEMLFFKQEIK